MEKAPGNQAAPAIASALGGLGPSSPGRQARTWLKFYVRPGALGLGFRMGGLRDGFCSEMKTPDSRWWMIPCFPSIFLAVGVVFCQELCRACSGRVVCPKRRQAGALLFPDNLLRRKHASKQTTSANQVERTGLI